MKSLIKRIIMNRTFLKVKFSVLAVLVISLIFLQPLAIVQAHGVNINYQAEMVYRIEANFDNGQPIANGQVTIYAPNNPTEVWGEGFTNDEGVYLFAPDKKITGDWTIKIRQAGHGSLITIPIVSEDTLNGDEEAIGKLGITSGSTGLSLAQKLLMVACVVWGTIGTVLYFKRRAE